MWWRSARRSPPRPGGVRGCLSAFPGCNAGGRRGAGLAMMTRPSHLRVGWGVGRGGIGGPVVGEGPGGAGAVPRPTPLHPCWSSRMVGRRLACRDEPRLARSSLNPRARTSGRRARGLSDVLGGYPTISRAAAPDAAAPRTPGRAFRPRERRLDHRGPTAFKWSKKENAAMSPLNNLLR